MYASFYQFECMPFENTPDPRFFYASEQHREALAAIEYTIRMRKGIVLITGDIGSGKTTVGRTMIKRCASRATLVQLAQGHQHGSELLIDLLRHLAISAPAQADRALVMHLLEKRLAECSRRNRPVVLFVDEAQTLSDSALEQLRLLGNFDNHNHKLLQLVLVGQPELRDRISAPHLSALRQRIVMTKLLRPLNIHETAGYIAHRLRAASCDKNRVQASFSGDAIQQLYAFTQGVPRLINVVCDNCMLLGFVKETGRITPTMVEQVIADMVPSFGQMLDYTESEAPVYKLAGNF